MWTYGIVGVELLGGDAGVAGPAMLRAFGDGDGLRRSLLLSHCAGCVGAMAAI